MFLAVVVFMLTMLAIRLPVAGKLIGTFGLERETAVLIVALVQSGALAYVAAVYPFLLAVLGTIQLGILTLGTAAVIGW
jgi:hypothetical protein